MDDWGTPHDQRETSRMKMGEDAPPSPKGHHDDHAAPLRPEPGH